MPTTAHDLDTALARVAAGDVGALRRVYDLTRGRLYAHALRILRRHDLAEDVLQDVFVKVWRHARTFDPSRGRPMTWLIAMTRHRAIDVLRAQPFEGRDAIALDAETSADPDGNTALVVDAADDLMRQAMDGTRLALCLAKLKPMPRLSVALAYYHGMSHSEIAQHLAVPLGSVKGWIHRSLDHMRACMED